MRSQCQLCASWPDWQQLGPHSQPVGEWVSKCTWTKDSTTCAICKLTSKANTVEFKESAPLTNRCKCRVYKTWLGPKVCVYQWKVRARVIFNWLLKGSKDYIDCTLLHSVILATLGREGPCRSNVSDTQEQKEHHSEPLQMNFNLLTLWCSQLPSLPFPPTQFIVILLLNTLKDLAFSCTDFSSGTVSPTSNSIMFVSSGKESFGIFPWFKKNINLLITWK